jgi:hypothetical protein
LIYDVILGETESSNEKSWIVPEEKDHLHVLIVCKQVIKEITRVFYKKRATRTCTYLFANDSMTESTNCHL